MTTDLFGKGLPFFGGIHCMEAAPVKGKTKWRSFNVAFEDVEHSECTRDIRFCSFLSGLIYRNLRCINADDLETLLRKPDGVIASSASNVKALHGAMGTWLRSGRG